MIDMDFKSPEWHKLGKKMQKELLDIIRKTNKVEAEAQPETNT